MKAIKVLSEILESNNDFYDCIKYWYLFMDDKGRVIKEIGFDENGRVLYKAPYKKNYGLFTDSPVIFDSTSDFEVIDVNIFNVIWNKNTINLDLNG